MAPLVLHLEKWDSFQEWQLEADNRLLRIKGRSQSIETWEQTRLSSEQSNRLWQALSQTPWPSLGSRYNATNDSTPSEHDWFELEWNLPRPRFCCGNIAAAPQPLQRCLAELEATLNQPEASSNVTVVHALRARPMIDTLALPREAPDPAARLQAKVRQLKADQVAIFEITARELDKLPAMEEAVRRPRRLVPLVDVEAVGARTGNESQPFISTPRGFFVLDFYRGNRR